MCDRLLVCISPVMVKDCRCIQGVSLPFAHCMLGKAQRLWAWNRLFWSRKKRAHEWKHRLFMAASSVPVREVGGHPRVGSDNGAGGGGVGSRRQAVFTANPRGRPRHRAHHPSAVTWSTPAASKTGTRTVTNPPLFFLFFFNIIKGEFTCTKASTSQHGWLRSLHADEPGVLTKQLTCAGLNFLLPACSLWALPLFKKHPFTFVRYLMEQKHHFLACHTKCHTNLSLNLKNFLICPVYCVLIWLK